MRQFNFINATVIKYSVNFELEGTGLEPRDLFTTQAHSLSWMCHRSVNKQNTESAGVIKNGKKNQTLMHTLNTKRWLMEEM